MNASGKEKGEKLVNGKKNQKSLYQKHFGVGGGQPTYLIKLALQKACG